MLASSLLGRAERKSTLKPKPESETREARSPNRGLPVGPFILFVVLGSLKSALYQERSPFIARLLGIRGNLTQEAISLGSPSRKPNLWLHDFVCMP